MKEKISELWKEYQAGLMTLAEFYNRTVDLLSLADQYDGSNIVVNTENPKGSYPLSRLEIFINEDEIILEEDISNKQCVELEKLGAAVV